MPRPLHQQPLHDGWRFRAADPRLGDTAQSAALDDWHRASDHQDLIAHGVIPDPLIGRETRRLGVTGPTDRLAGAITLGCLNPWQDAP